MIAMLETSDQSTLQIRRQLAAARRAQLQWANRSLGERARLIGQLRPLIARHATELARLTASIKNRPLGEKLVSEVLPLLEATRFLEKNATRILKTKHFGRVGRPRWLHGHSFAVHRKPFGLVLIVGPRNYPLFIPAVQMLHALVAGNAVLVKPAERATAPISFLLDRIIRESELPAELIQILPEAPEAARQAVRCGVDKAIFTGSSENGRNFLVDLAEQNTPSIMELSGTDIVFVRHDADVELAAKAIAFGLRLNNGDTCMAPHTIIAQQDVAAELSARLRDFGFAIGDIFIVQDDEQALEVAEVDEHGLGASMFSRDESAARAFAQQLRTGFVTINDIIVPTADPRLPFGGVRGSGFGVTRGEEGLLEMTHPQAVTVRRARFLPHLDPPEEGDAQFFSEFISLAHGQGWRRRIASLRKLIQLASRRARTRKS